MKIISLIYKSLTCCASKVSKLAIQGINDQQLAQEQAKISEQARINQDLINQQIAHEEATYQASIQYQQKQQELRDKIAILDIEAGKDEYKKQLDLLAKNQEIELRSVEDNELAKAEIQKRYANQRVKVESYAASEMGEMAMATSNAGSAVMLMPTVTDLIDVNVKNNEQLIKMAAIAQRAATVNANSGTDLINMDEINALLEEQKAVQEQGNKLLEQAPIVQLEITK